MNLWKRVNSMGILSFLINDVITQAPIFLGLVALIGLLLQKKDAAEVFTGTIKTITGTVVLLAGVDLFLGVLLPLMALLQEKGSFTGVMPDNQAPFGVVMTSFAKEIPIAFVLGFLIHLLLVRVLPFKNTKNVFLTGHIMLFLSGFWVAILAWNFGLKGSGLILAGSICTDLILTVFPAISRPFTKEIAEDEYTLGHMFNVSVVVGSLLGNLFNKSKKSDDIELPGFLASFSDFSILLSTVMPLIFIGIGLVVGESEVTTLSGDMNWLMFLIMQGIKFSGSIMITLFGVRTFLGSIIPAFQGISEKLLPGAIPALDCPVFYPYAPVAAIIGFLGHAVGAIISVVIMVSIAAPVIPLPSALFIFFEGSLAGVFGDRKGGWKGALLAGVVVSLITHMGVAVIAGLQEPLLPSGLVFGSADIVLISPIIYFFKLLFGI